MAASCEQLFTSYAHDFADDYADLCDALDGNGFGKATQKEIALLPNGKLPPAKPFRYPEIHNEIRMAFTHLVRVILPCERNDLKNLIDSGVATNRETFMEKIGDVSSQTPPSPEARDKELELASKHIQRASMDAKKCLYMVRLENADKILEPYRDCSIGHLDSGKFFEKVGNFRRTGQAAFRKAKLSESLGHHDIASSYYKSSNKEANNLTSYIKSKVPEMRSAKRRYRMKSYAVIGPLAIALAGAALFLAGW